ncbi:MAG TPA: hypothetical protein VIQ31_34580 [Phormidium sp.]
MVCQVMRKIPENNIQFLMARYQVSDRTIRNWRAYLGLSRSGNQYLSNAEIQELDGIYIMCQVHRGNSRWRGLKMTITDYLTQVIGEGLTLDQWLTQTWGISYDQYVRGIQRLNNCKIFHSTEIEVEAMAG